MKITVRPRTSGETTEPPRDCPYISRMEGEPDDIEIPVDDTDWLTDGEPKHITLRRAADSYLKADSEFHSDVRFIPVRIVEIVVEEL